MIVADDLGRRFGTMTAVEHLSVCVPDGTILALLGPNGAGKTTTVRMLAGLLAPTTGTATVGGYDVRRDPAAVRACVGLVTDVPGLYEQMSVPSYLDFFGAMYGVAPAGRTRRIDELIGFFELETHPALLYAVIADVCFLAEVGLFVGVDTLRLLPAALALTMVALVPTYAVLGAAVASLISSRVRTYQSAQTLSSLVLLPVMGVLFTGAFAMQRWGPWLLLGGVVVMIVVDVALITVSAATWRREGVMARL